jgi:hypothetical protein
MLKKSRNLDLKSVLLKVGTERHASAKQEEVNLFQNFKHRTH